MLTFDHARAAFRCKPSRQTARQYTATAKALFVADVISADMLRGVDAELAVKGYEAAFRDTLPAPPVAEPKA